MPIFSMSSPRRNMPIAFRIKNMMAARMPAHAAMQTTSTKLAKSMALPMPLVSQVPSLAIMHLKPLQPCATSKPSPQSKKPAASTPHMPQAPCTAKASIGSSTLQMRTRLEAPWHRNPPKTPVKTAEPCSMLPQPAVIETRPARMPLQRPPISYLRSIAKRNIKTTRPPQDAERVVFMATCPAMNPFSIVSMASVEPQLKPYQPNQRMKVPRTMRGWLWGSNFSGASSTRCIKE
mmetsp:Transcript_44407/g.102607  ORF Transcript_44407/g.102607 Transcript_44407/m.102607 type:complete len:234 (-) Transcript_44407:923-1624(-)